MEHTLHLKFDKAEWFPDIFLRFNLEGQITGLQSTWSWAPLKPSWHVWDPKAWFKPLQLKMSAKMCQIFSLSFFSFLSYLPTFLPLYLLICISVHFSLTFLSFFLSFFICLPMSLPPLFPFLRFFLLFCITLLPEKESMCLMSCCLFLFLMSVFPLFLVNCSYYCRVETWTCF